MGEINQRELRGNLERVLRRVEAGERLTVTRAGMPVARLVPIGDTSLVCERPAKPHANFSMIPRVTASETADAILDDVRGEF